VNSFFARFVVEASTGGISVDPSAEVPARTPVQLTGVFDAEALEARIYLDGKLAEAKCSTFSSAIGALSEELTPGVGLGGHVSYGGGLYSFLGLLDEVRIYDGAMTPGEVAASTAP
jgi:hypothetical protein